MNNALDPSKTVCVVKDKTGREVGRIAATAANTTDYIQGCIQQHGDVTVEYVEDATFARVSDLLSRPR